MNDELIQQQQELLVIYRRTLHHYIKQVGIVGEGHITPEISNGILEARNSLIRIKQNLRSLDIEVEDYPEDNILSNGSINRLKKKILVVDDGEKIRELLELILTDAGYDVVQAENGLEGFNIAVKEEPDLIILDIEMPKMNGYTFLVKIVDRRIRTRIIMLSIASYPGVVSAYLRAGASSYVYKPFHIPKFLDLVANTINTEETIDIVMLNKEKANYYLIDKIDKIMSAHKEDLSEYNRFIELIKSDISYLKTICDDTKQNEVIQAIIQHIDNLSRAIQRNSYTDLSKLFEVSKDTFLQQPKRES